MPHSPAPGRVHPPVLPGIGWARLVFAGSGLVWIVQAAALAVGVQRVADGGGLDAVLQPAAICLALGLLRATADAWAARRLFRAARTFVSETRARAGEAVAAQSPLGRARLASGQAASALAEQAEALLPWLLRYQPARARAVLVPVVTAVAVGSLSWVAALILVVAAPMIPLAMAFVGWRAKAASEAQLQAMGGMHAFLLDRLRGLGSLRALGAVDATGQRVRAAAEDLRRRTMRVLRIAFLSSAALELFSALSVALVAVYVGFHLLGQIGGGAWGRQLSLSEGLFILLLAPAFFEPLRELSAAWHDKAAGEAALESLEALHRPALPLPGAGQAAVPAVHDAARTPPAVVLRGLSFAYPGERPVFEDAHLHIRAGEHVAVVGPSGAGKTSLLALVAGLVPAGRGDVLIGDTRLDAGTAASLRRRMAWVGQQPHVFAGSVQDNVTLHRPGVSRRDVADALRAAGLHGDGPLQADRPMGEGGSGLSGGECVRLALARAAVASHADLWLLDEPTAHLDAATAATVVDALLKMAGGRTLVLATHDLAVAARVGRIVHVDRLDGLSSVGKAA